MNIVLRACMFALVAVPWTAVLAAEKLAPYECMSGDVPESSIFKEIQTEARAINDAFCKALSVPVSAEMGLRNRVADFATQVQQVTAPQFARTGLDKMVAQLNYFTGQVRSGVLHPTSMPVFVVEKPASPNDPSMYYFNGNQNDGKAGALNAAIQATCRTEFNATCEVVLLDFENAIRPYQVNYSSFAAHRTYQKLDELSTRWDAFFAEGRAQTTLDLVLTTAFERDHLRSRHLVGPPTRQWFVLHPEVVLEYVEGAAKGSRFEPGLAVEWIGVNWWEDSWIGLPLGFSLTSLYSERAAVKDVGHGVTVHVNNSLSLGWVRRGRDTGYYISMDLLNVFENSQDRVAKFKDALKQD